MLRFVSQTLQGKPRLCAVAALVLLSLVWGYNWVVMKIVLQDAPPFLFAALRTFLGAICLLPILYFQGRLRWPQSPLQVVLLGLLQTTGFIGFMMWALLAGAAGKTAMLVYLMPFWVLILAGIFLNERLDSWQRLVMVPAFGGLVLILEPWHFSGDLTPKLLALGSGLCWAGGAVLGKRLCKTTHADLLGLTAWQMLLGSLPLVAVCFLIPESPVTWSGYLLAALVYNVVLCNALAFILWFYILKKLPAGIAGLGTLGTPLLGVLAAWVQLGERPGLFTGIGMGLIAWALFLLCRPWRGVGCRQKRPRNLEPNQELERQLH